MTDQSKFLPFLRAQASGQSLARPFYLDADPFQADLTQIWYRDWIFADPVAELPKAGS